MEKIDPAALDVFEQMIHDEMSMALNIQAEVGAAPTALEGLGALLERVQDLRRAGKS